MARILLLVEDGRDRQLLAESLGADHDVLDLPPGPDAFRDTEFDCCVLDGAAFRAQRDVLVEKKDEVAPVFLPHLLLLEDAAAEQASDAVWEHVDEVITMPMERAELESRLENLLQRRELSLELNRRKEFTEQRFRTLFDSTPDPIVVVTDDGIVTEVNDAFTRLFGCDHEAVVGEHVGEIEVTPEESVERLLLRVDEHAIADETATEGTVEVEAADGDRHLTELNVEVVEELGEATERIGIFRDVTGREEHQQELERQIDQLERLADLIAHDLRNPLNVAQAKTRLLQAQYDDATLEELGEVHERMETLVEDVLQLTRQGQTVGQTRPVELGTVVTDAWATVETPGSANLDPASTLPVVEADDERLQALLENLFRNAVDHGGAAVTVEVGVLDDAAGFYVADDGPGIPLDARDDVFEYGHTTDEEGTGLGLAIVQQIAEAHGWTVTVTEAADGGARFEVRGVINR